MNDGSSRFFIFSEVLQACNENSPYEGPFRKDAPSWCYAPFEPEGILRFVAHHYNIIYYYLDINPNPL